MKYILKKLFALIITLLIVSFLAFLAFSVIPGDPTAKILGMDASPEQVAALRAQLGLDKAGAHPLLGVADQFHHRATSAPATVTARAWGRCSRTSCR